MEPIQFIDLKSQRSIIAQKLDSRLATVFENCQFIMGPEVKELEAALCDFSGAKHCISCANGTDALQILLMARGVGPGDVVFVPSMTFISTAEVISLLGATPIFIDVSEDSFNVNGENLEQALEAFATHPLKDELTARGIIAVDLFGQPAPYEEINRIAAKHDLWVIDDAAQSFGAMRNGKRVGMLAKATATSFFPAKPLGCFGDGGAMFTDDDSIAEVARSIRVHGKGSHKYDNARVGINSRLDTLQAAVLLEKLVIYEDEIKRRNEIATNYSGELGDVCHVPIIPEGVTSVWALYSIKTDRRDELATFLQSKGIPTGVYYPKPLHLQEAFANLSRQELPVSKRLSEISLSLPMHPYLTDDQVEYITSSVRTFYGR